MIGKRVLFLAVAFLLVLTMVPLAQVMADPEPPEGAEAESEPGYDRRFIDFMVPHHESGIMMAEIALARSTNEQVRMMAQEEIDTQSEEIKKMKEWREEWYGSEETPPITDIPAMPETPHRESGVTRIDMTPMIEMVRNAPADLFDLVFLDQMILHHADAIEAAIVERHHDGHDEMYDLARKIALEQHEGMMDMAELRDMLFFGGPVPTATMTPMETMTGTETLVPTETLQPTLQPTLEPTLLPTLGPTETPSLTETVETTVTIEPSPAVP